MHYIYTQARATILLAVWKNVQPFLEKEYEFYTGKEQRC